MRHLLTQSILCLLLVSNDVLAGEMDACYQTKFTQTDRMADLPPEVSGLVYANSRGDRDLSALPKEQQNLIQSGQV